MRTLNIFVLRKSGEIDTVKDTHGLSVFEGTVVGRGTEARPMFDVLMGRIIDTDLYWDQPIERFSKYCLMVGKDSCQIRIYESMGERGRVSYCVHTERRPSLGKIDFSRFIDGVLFSLATDPIDIRRAVSLGEKFGSIAPGADL